MKRRLTLLILAVTLPVLFISSWVMSQQSFQLSLQREKQRAQWMESLVYGTVQSAMTARNLKYAQAVELAWQYRSAYAAQGIELQFLWQGTPMTASTLEEDTLKQLYLGQRAALLVEEEQLYLVAEPLSSAITLVVACSVAPLYDQRQSYQRTAVLVSLGASLLVAALTLLLTGLFTRPIRRLTAAAEAMAQGTGDAVALPLQRKDEIGTLSRAFSAMEAAVGQREEALRLESEERQRLLDALAHEMRTPLTSLLGNLRLMQLNLPTEERTQLAESMAAEVKRLSDMDQQLLKLTRLPHDPPLLQPVALLPLLQETAARLKPQLHGVQLTVTGEDVTVTGDAELLRLMADNLAVNAIRASQPGQTVTLSTVENGFKVQDAGCGMDAQQLQHACEPFWRADKARTRAQGGAGLGLSLCQAAARQLGGTLHFTSAPGEGTTVSFTTSLHPVADSVTSPVVA